MASSAAHASRSVRRRGSGGWRVPAERNAALEARGYAAGIGPARRSGAPLAAVRIVVRPTTTSLEERVDLYAVRIMSIAERISLALRYRA